VYPASVTDASQNVNESRASHAATPPRETATRAEPSPNFELGSTDKRHSPEGDT